MPAVLAVVAWLHIFGWLALPPMVAIPGEGRLALARFEDWAHPNDDAWPFVLPTSPVHVGSDGREILTRVSEAAAGPCCLIVGGTPTRYELLNPDVLAIVADLCGLAVEVVPGDALVACGSDLPRRQLPFFLLQSGYPPYGSEQKAATCYRHMMGVGEPVEMRIVAAHELPDGFNMVVYRVVAP